VTYRSSNHITNLQPANNTNSRE